MDTIQIIVDIIKTVGFPIAMCVALVYMWREEVRSHKEESAAFAKALEANTEVLRDIKDVLRNANGK
jgi:large-conductance mechanosensitive channel